jgi:hypothetical protein
VIALDGAAGEGGGQVLRTALSLALVTGQPFTLTNVRAGRPKPGLQRQHLTAVLAAKALVLDRGGRLADEARAHRGDVLLHARGNRWQRQAAVDHHPRPVNVTLWPGSGPF